MERKQKCSAPPLIIKSMRLLPKSKMPPILRNAPDSPHISHHLLYPPPCPSRLRSLCPWTSNTCMTHFTNTETSRPLIPHEPRLLSSVIRVHAFLFSNTKSRMMDWRASRRHCGHLSVFPWSGDSPCGSSHRCNWWKESKKFRMEAASAFRLKYLKQSVSVISSEETYPYDLSLFPCRAADTTQKRGQRQRALRHGKAWASMQVEFPVLHLISQVHEVIRMGPLIMGQRH